MRRIRDSGMSASIKIKLRIKTSIKVKSIRNIKIESMERQRQEEV